ncbi:MAG TPA: hypothetical protein VNT75_25240 [Symbiobacteriaceae bacterium]|nr:hypothetical protein [Symbiobacteriaceae bacterium]
MNEAAFQKFQTWLQNQGVGPDDAAYLANLWGEIAQVLRAPVGMGAQAEGDDIFIYLHVPNKQDGIRISLADVEAMDDPAGELAEMVRTRLMG